MLLLGASGAGKSTLLAALAGLLDGGTGGESEGVLLTGGRPPHRAREGTGFLMQDPDAQIVLARAGDDVAFGLENRCVASGEIWDRVDAALAAVDFPYPRDHPTGALSGGEKQRLALAGVLALHPTLLLLDEPTANLDAHGAALFRAVLRQVLRRAERTLILVEHHVTESLPLVERVVVLEAGSGVIADGRPGQVFGTHGGALAAAGG